MEDQDQEPRAPLRVTNRRTLLLGAAGGIIAGGSLATRVPGVLGSDDDDDDSHSGHDEDDDRDDDHSGHGRGGEDTDRDDDHSGHGGGGEDDDRDDDDDDVEIRGQVPAGSTEIGIVEDHPGGFVPGSVTIQQGEQVTFVNAHDDPHTATGSTFDTGIIQPGDMVTVSFDTAGTFNYACQIHPEMTGTIIVEPAPGASPEAATPAASPVANGDATVTIANIAFNPANLTVKTGTTVTWTNQDLVPHTATGTDPGQLQSGTIQPGEAFSQRFDTPGTIDYVCEFHPSMKATLTIEPA